MNPDIIIEQYIHSISQSLNAAELMRRDATPEGTTQLSRRIRILKAMLVAATKES